MQQIPVQNPNKPAIIILWIGFSCYALTTFLPIVTFTFFFSVNAMIYDVLSELGLALFFGGLISALIGAVSKNNATIFKIGAILAGLLAILPILAIFLVNDYVFFSMSIGFYAYVIGAILCFIAGIMFKSPSKIQRQIIQQQNIQQPMQYQPNQPQIFLQYPRENPQPLTQQPQTHEKTIYCPHCREMNTKDAKFCTGCGQKID